jgi:hypothetical protein
MDCAPLAASQFATLGAASARLQNERLFGP